jgi:hypothetical protein
MFALTCAFAMPLRTQAQGNKNPYPTIAPVEQYLMDRDAEIAQARSAAPDSISHDATVLVLGRHGYETAAEGKNGFVCVVERSWVEQFDDPEFWNPKIRGPICYKPPAVRSILPITMKRTEMVFAGLSLAEMNEVLRVAFDKKELQAPEPGALGYMMSKGQYLGDPYGHWHPHLMFEVPHTAGVVWGAGLPNSPIIVGAQRTPEPVTIFVVPVPAVGVLRGETAPLPPLTTPVAYADFPKEVLASPLSWIKQTYNVVQYTQMPRGSHFAALERPDLLVDDVRKFFANGSTK